MTQEPTPHDPFVKTVFADLALAAEELRAVLPPSLVARIDWSTLKREPGSFVDEALKSRLTDMLFSMRTQGGHDLRVYVLFEHQSHADRWMVLRALEYTVRIWSELRARHPNAKHLPVVIPVVLHHGERGWRAPRELHELVDPLVRELPELAALVPQARIVVDDLATLTDDDLERRSHELALRVALWLLRDGRRRDRLLASLARWGPMLAELVLRPGGIRAFQYQLAYLYKVADDDVRVAFLGLLDHTSEASRDAVMTIEEMLINQGIAKGLEKGRVEGRVEEAANAIFRVLETRKLPVSEALRARVLDCSNLEELGRLLARAIDVARAEDLFAN
jgi:predicted transposase YdaD